MEKFVCIGEPGIDKDINSSIMFPEAGKDRHVQIDEIFCHEKEQRKSRRKIKK